MNRTLDQSIIYQIYPASFYDSNGDGIGDLEGIRKKIGYLESLGVDLVWLNPIFESPFLDGGYDVTDFRRIAKRYGTMRDFSRLVSDLHARGMRLLLDLPIGHTSIFHPWFRQSQKKKRNAYSDYYIWTDSNFVSENRMLSGVSERDGCVAVNYYSHQPALNYGYSEIGDSSWKIHCSDERLRPLRQEIVDIMKFWLAAGADGFRIDLACSLVKPIGTEASQNALCRLWREMIGTVRETYPSAVFLAEWGDPVRSVGQCGFDADYFSHERAAYNELFRNEPGTNVLSALEKGYNYFSEAEKGTICNLNRDAVECQNAIRGKGYYCIPTGYHDVPRLSVGKSASQLKVIFAFLMTYKHLPLIYYGDEIGIRYNPSVSKEGGYNRTGARTPMQWDESGNRGFSENKRPYLPVGRERRISVSAQDREENSLLHCVKALSALRKKHAALGYGGDLEILNEENGGYPFVYRRSLGNESVTVLLNPGKNQKTVPLDYSEFLLGSGSRAGQGKIILDSESFAIVK